LTKRTAEELTITCATSACRPYLHSEIDAIERVEILRSLRKGEFDVLVGIQSFARRTGFAGVSLVAILDADKEGFSAQRNDLIQTPDAPRAIERRSDPYADVMTQGIQKFSRRHQISPRKTDRYNVAHNITRARVVRAVEESLATYESDAKRPIWFCAKAARTLTSPRRSRNSRPKCSRPPRI